MEDTKSPDAANIPVVLFTRGRSVLPLTERRIRDEPPPASGQRFVWDTEVPAFGLRITATGVRSFVVQKRVHGKLTRLTIGRVGDISLKFARDEATKRLAEIAAGRDPLQEKRDAAKNAAKAKALEEVTALTLGAAFDQYLEARTLKPSTAKDYTRLRNKDFKIWEDTLLRDITSTMVAERHRKLLEQAQKQDKKYCRNATGARANNAMRVLRAVFNFAAHQLAEHGIELRNPVARLTQTRSWNRIDRKNSYISAADLPAWWRALKGITSDTMRDYLLLVLFTGLRREEAAQLLWKNVDFNLNVLTIVDPKNHRDHTLPMSSFVLELLQRRHAKRGDHTVVFPGRGATGHLETPWKTLQKIRDDTGIACSVHDLRRTFATMAAPLVPYPTLKRLLNHKSNEDVTLHYAMPDLAELRQHIQRVTDHILRIVEPSSAKVVQLRG